MQDSINSPGDDVIEGSKYHVVVNQSGSADKGVPGEFDLSQMTSNY